MGALSEQLLVIKSGVRYQPTPEVRMPEPARGLGDTFREILHRGKPTTAVTKPIDLLSVSVSTKPTIHHAIVKSIATTLFDRTFGMVSDEVTYQSVWKKGGDFFMFDLDSEPEGIPSVVSPRPEKNYIQVCKMKKSVDDKGRRMIFIGTRMGTVVVYEMKPHGSASQEYRFAGPKELRNSRLLGWTMILSDEYMQCLLGDEKHTNIGYTIESFYDACMLQFQKGYQ